MDRILVDGRPPLVVTGAPEWDAASLLAEADHDLLHVREAPVVLRFQVGRREAPARLGLLARIEAETIPGVPFKFPEANRRLARDEHDFFYTHPVLGPRSEMTPVFAQHCSTASGHPAAVIQASAGHADGCLRVRLDFAPDNTLDGDKDWAAVHVLTRHGVRTFRCSQEETRWGRVGFTASDAAPWRHKVYDFEIPLQGLDAAGSRPAVKLAFSAYGTATAYGDNDPAMAFDAAGRTGLLAYRHAHTVATPGGTTDVCEIRGRWLDAMGLPRGPSFRIDAAVNPDRGRYHPDVAFDADSNRYLVVWTDNDTGSYHIHGRIFSPDFSYDSGVFTVSSACGSMFGPNCAWADSSGKYLVTWYDNRQGVGDNEIFFRTVTAHGVVEGTVDKTLSDNAEQDRYPEVVFNTDSDTFFVVWSYESAGTGLDVWSARVSDAGAMVGSATAVCIESGNQFWPMPAADPDRGQVLVCWTNEYAVHDWDVYARFAYSNGSMKGAGFPVSVSMSDQSSLRVAFSGKRDAYLLAWSDDRADGTFTDLYARTVSGDGTVGAADFAVLKVPGYLVLGEIAACGFDGHFAGISQHWEPAIPMGEIVALRAFLYPGFMPTGALHLLTAP